MQIGIPHAPRAVKLSQVPGAFWRLLRFAVAASALACAAGVAGRGLSRMFSADVARHDRAVPIIGIFSSADLPPPEARDGALGTMTVLYEFEGRQNSADGVAVAADVAEGWGPGKKVALYVDPADPAHPWEADVLDGRARRADLAPWGFLIAALAGAGGFVWQLRRVLARELEPLRLGRIVWLTPDGPIPDGRGELSFRAHYFHDGNPERVRARLRGRRAPVRNGEKVLAAVSPRFPSWARVIEEELARELGWMRS